MQIEDFAVKGSIVDCDNNPVSNGLIKIEIGEQTQTFLIEGDGSFDIQVLNCESLRVFKLQEIDIDGLEVGNIIEKSISSTVDCGTIEACGNSICVADNKFVGEYMLTLEGISDLGYGPAYQEQIVELSTVSGSFTLRSFRSIVLPDIGGFGPYTTTFEILCDKAVYNLMDTQGLGCGGGGIMFGRTLDENGAIITEPLDPSDDSSVVLFFDAGFADGGCPWQTGETQTKMILTKL